MSALVSRTDAESFRGVVAARLGLHFDDGKLDELSTALRARMLALQAPTVDAYVARLDALELGALAERLTVGETYFFRYREQFEAFGEVALPAVLRDARRPIRVLSAGCATGDEAYTLAIIARERPDAVEVIGCDVNPAAIARAKQGRYTTWSLRETPAPTRERYFEQDGGQYQLASEVRDAVRFERRNLLEEDTAFWQADAFDVVFCRNVLMYFGADAMRGVVARIARALAPVASFHGPRRDAPRHLARVSPLPHARDVLLPAQGQPRRRAISGGLSGRHEVPAGALPMPVALGLDSSWIDVIQQASERVAKLASQRPPGPAGAPASPRARADTAPVLDMMRSERFEDALDLLGTFSPSDPETQLLRADPPHERRATPRGEAVVRRAPGAGRAERGCALLARALRGARG